MPSEVHAELLHIVTGATRIRDWDRRSLSSRSALASAAGLQIEVGSGAGFRVFEVGPGADVPVQIHLKTFCVLGQISISHDCCRMRLARLCFLSPRFLLLRLGKSHLRFFVYVIIAR